MTEEPEWISLEDALFFHAQIVAMFGGATEVRDRGLLESALDRPRNVFAYESKDLFVLAAAYAHGIAKNHPFMDGNKRLAFTITRIFLGLNDVTLDPPEAEAVVMVEALASGELAQADFRDWLRKHSKVRRDRG